MSSTLQRQRQHNELRLLAADEEVSSAVIEAAGR
jgi:hypothetical protein